LAERKHISRGLRFTLTAVYTVVFTILLVAVTLIFRQTLASSLEEQATDDLNQTWAVVKGTLRIEGDADRLNWYFDPNDPDDNDIRARVQRVYLIADSGGAAREWSTAYQALGFDSADYIKKTLESSPSQPLWQTKHDPAGVPYLIRASYILNEKRDRKFFIAIGTSLAANDAVLTRFTWLCLALIPLVVLLGMATGWVVAGRALRPVMQIARAAQRISGSNLSLRIPERSAADELEYLIETFNAMIARLEQNFNQVRQFSTDVSHELRTPITVIRGQLEVALLTAKTAEQYRDAIVDTLGDVERLSQIVRALLLLSQAETGQVILQLQSLDLVETARNITEQFEIPAEGAGVALSFHAGAEACQGDFDRVQIERMLSNLLSNAIKFTPQGGRINVGVLRSGDHAEIVVVDTGQGIPPEHLPLIFDRFYRVRGPEDQASPEKGLGLGLSFVNWIVKAHGGTVEVQSEPGKGTTFRVRLPLHPPALPRNITLTNVSVNTEGEYMKPV
jgi:heavy metal sensor kinase